MVLFLPAGIWEGDNVIATAGRFILQLGNEVKTRLYKLWDKDGPRTADMVQQEAGRVVKGSPGTVAKQVVGIPDVSIAADVKRFQKEGMNVGVLCGDRDMLFPLYRRPNKIAKETGVPRDRIRIIKGTHGAPTDYSDESAEEVDRMFKEFEK
jgi:hypothetical protein